MNANTVCSAVVFEMKFKTRLSRVGDERIAPVHRRANEKKAQIRENRLLSEPQRKVALEMLRQQTEEEMRHTLGEREFSAFKMFHHYWFRDLAAAT